MKKIIVTFILFFSISLLTVQADSVVTGIEEGYEDVEVMIEADDTYVLTIDGESYESGVVYSEIGYHVLEVYENDIIIETIHFTIHPQFNAMNPDIDKQIILDEFRLSIQNHGEYSLYVNFSKVTTAKLYKDYGRYFIQVEGANGYQEIFEFTLLPSNLEAIENNRLEETLYLDATHAEELYLDGELIEDNRTVTKYGNYEVLLHGINGFTKTYTFSKAVPSSVVVNGTYTTEVTIPTLHARKVYVDGNKLTESIKISDIGNHVIVFLGENGYTEEFNIIIKEDIDYEEGEEYVSFTLKDVDATLYLNGEPYTQGTRHTDIGLYTLTIFGTRGYEKQISFTVRPPLEVTDGAIVKDFDIKTYGANVTLNGETYESETKITELGNYTLIIKGIGNHQEEFTFQIRDDFPIEDDEVLKRPIDLNVNIEHIIVNGKEVDYGTRIYKTGEYEITFKGVGGYSETFNVSYTNPNQNLYPIFTIITLSLTVVVAAIYIPVLIRRFKWFF